MGHCASCHARNLQGQPLWQLIDEYAGRRAPAHDETGHTWQHSDEGIFHMIKYGRFPSTPAGVISFMPPAEAVLSDREILDVMQSVFSAAARRTTSPESFAQGRAAPVR